MKDDWKADGTGFFQWYIPKDTFDFNMTGKVKCGVMRIADDHYRATIVWNNGYTQARADTLGEAKDWVTRTYADVVISEGEKWLQKLKEVRGW